MFILYLSKGDKRATERILLRNAREDELPALMRVFLNNGWRVVIERIDGDDTDGSVVPAVRGSTSRCAGNSKRSSKKNCRLRGEIMNTHLRVG